ncbi:uncharacterized protein ccdc14 isoform X3 [Corythoichthys intestinalis]|uniref:uncharacterized protein ccdc14 isoform X3 n=1 Tax=Corythoichthys intestinalis TaxID=161448 RepID=UPI0025A4DAC4|nr:uncharacterized protein ccdc14 isoform X3 [Corythoichthys intestinalis]
MKGSVKRKVLTSGRPTSGGPTVQQARKRPTIPGRKEPTCSFYSTDPQEEVANLHVGLDRCADLLSTMLQVDKAVSYHLCLEAVTHPPKVVNGGPARVKPSTAHGRKNAKTLTPMTGVKKAQTLPHSNLHPPLRASQPLQGSSHSQSLTSVLLSVTQRESALHSTHSSQRSRRQTDYQPVVGHHKALLNVEKGDSVPVKDTDPKRDTCLSMHAYDKKIDLGQPCDTDHHAQSGEDSTGKLRTVHYLLGELKALIAGKGSVAERLLSHLEITVSSPQVNSLDPGKTADIEALHIQNDQLHRQVAFLNKQLEREKKLNTETLSKTQESLPEDLAAAQSRQQELQVILGEVRATLLDTKKLLHDREAENAMMKLDLENLRTKFVQSEQEKYELVSLAQQRQEQIEHLERTIKSGNILQCHTDLTTSNAVPKEQCNDQGDATEHITKYLMTLGQPEASPKNRNVQMVAEREDNTLEKAKLSSTPLGKLQLYPYHCNDSHSEVSDGVHLAEEQMGKERRRLFDYFSEGKVDTMSSDCSRRSMSTYDTRDEAAFRDGLAALDASIAILQKTIKQDLAS